MTGSVPHLATLPAGCAFASRCPDHFDACDREVPTLQDVDGNRAHRSACYENAAVLDAMTTKV